jgi:cobalamin biosynthesis Mg chelatase CobN
MTSRINAKQPPRKAQGSNVQKIPANPHAPSVPISLYREVATELKTTQAKLESLTVQNQQLTQQNQQLRVEIERVVQSALQLRQTADAHLPANRQLPMAPTASQGLELHFQPPAAPSATPPTPIALEHPEPAAPKSLFTEQEGKLRQPSSKERQSEMGGWWLAIVICFIIVTAFGTGFFIVRPLLPSR